MNKTEKYVVDAEDISDVENGNERNVDNNKVTEQVERSETSENVSVENKSSEENDDLNVKTEGEREMKKAEKEGELELTEGDVKDENEIQKQNKDKTNDEICKKELESTEGDVKDENKIRKQNEDKTNDEIHKKENIEEKEESDIHGKNEPDANKDNLTFVER